MHRCTLIKRSFTRTSTYANAQTYLCVYIYIHTDIPRCIQTINRTCTHINKHTYTHT